MGHGEAIFVMGFSWRWRPVLLLIFLLTLLADVGLFAEEADLALTIALNRNHPPYKFIDEQGWADGFLIDLWRMWGRHRNVKLSFVARPFPETVEMVRNGEADVHAGLFQTEERSRYLSFSDPIYDIHYFIIHNKGILGITDPRQLRGFLVGVPEGGYTETFMRERFPDVHLSVYPDYPALYRAAVSGEIFVFISPVQNLQLFLVQNDIENPFRYRETEPLFTQSYRSATQKDRMNLILEVNDGFHDIDPDSVSYLEEKWFGKSQPVITRDALKIAISPTYQPFSYVDPFGGPEGFFIDFWQLWSKKTGIPVTFIVAPWHETLQLIRDGRADIHSGLFPSPEKQKWMDFSEPFYEIASAMYYREDHQLTDQVSALQDIRMGVVKDSYQEEFARQKLPESADIIQFDSSRDMLFALIAERIDAFIDEIPVIGLMLLKERFAGRAIRSPHPLFYRSLRAGVKQSADSLLTLINEGIARITMQELSQLERQWIESQYTGQQRTASGTSTAERDSLFMGIVLTQDERDWLEKRAVFRVGVDVSWQPFAFTTSEEPFSGIAADYLQILGKRLGVEFRPVPVETRNQGLNAIREGTIDMLAAISKAPETSRFLVFTRPYFTSPVMIFTRVDAPFIGGVEDLFGQEVAFSETAGFLDHENPLFSGIQPRLYSSTFEALNAVSSGEVAAGVLTLSHGSWVIAHHNFVNLKIAAPLSGTLNEIRFGVRKDWLILRNILEKGLASISPEKSAEIRSRWISIRYEQGQELRRTIFWSAVIIGTFIFLTGIAFYWNRKLRAEIRYRHTVESSLKIAKEQAESADKLKSAFLATMSHELRTPLNSIIGFTGIVLKELPGPLNDEQKKQLEMVRKSSRHLLDLINDVLDISKIEAGQLTVSREKFDLDSSVLKVVHTVQPLADQKGLDLQLDNQVEGLEIISDRRRLEQILINLMTNAIKFTTEGSVQLRVRRTKSGNDRFLVFAVRDSGIGIKEEDMEKLFIPFRQIETGLNRRYEGTGLGLSICKKLSELLGGDITATSEWGEGSTFILRIPLKENEDA